MSEQHWKIERRDDGYVFTDDKGNHRGRYRDADIMSVHFVSALQEIERLTAERDEAREAARWWMRRDQGGGDPSVITDQLEIWMWPWLES